MLRVYTIAVANTMQTYTYYNIVIILKLVTSVKGCSLVDRASVAIRRESVRAPPADFFLARNSLDLANF